MNFGEAIASGFQNYVNFSSRASRSEYWYWVLFTVVVNIGTAVVDAVVFPTRDIAPINTLAMLAVLVPSFAVAVRRLHDIDRTGWWVLIAFTVIGACLLLYWNCLKGTDGDNRFGPDPLAGHPSLLPAS